MSQIPCYPVPYQMRMSGEMLMKRCEDPSIHAYQVLDSKVLPSGPKKITFPSTRAVLWNRKPIGKPSELYVPADSSNVKLLLNKRTLQLAQRQLNVAGEDFHGFCIGELQIQDGKICIIINRFDPGRNGQINTESGPEKIRIPTTTVPGDLNVPVLLSDGMAFVDHVTTQTHTEKEFIKTMKVLESWCSRKDALNVNNFFSSKIKCCFQANEDEILTYITCGLVFIKEKFSLVQVNPIPIIPTALARNLEGPVSLSDVQGRVKTGYITMDQTRKLLLLLETDPKANTLPLVGVWVSGIEDVHCAEVWACCTRFIHNRNIEERVYAPPDSFLLLTYLTKAVSVTFHEFSRKENGSDGLQFQFLTCCEGIAMNKDSGASSSEEEYEFDLLNMPTGALTSIFKRAMNKCVDVGNSTDVPDTKATDGASNITNHDDSIPLICPSISPHPQMEKQVHQSFPSVPDLSMCDSMVIESSEIPVNVDGKNDTDPQNNDESLTSPPRMLEPAVTKSMITNKKHSYKAPRQTKASIARMNLNKTPKDTASVKKCEKKANLAITFSNAKKVKDIIKPERPTISEKSAKLPNSKENIDEMEEIKSDEPRLKLPVKIRMSNEPKLCMNTSFIIEQSNEDCISDTRIDEVNDFNDHGKDSNVQPYCPDYYSDASGDDSFLIVSREETPIGESTLCDDSVVENSHVDDGNTATIRQAILEVSTKEKSNDSSKNTSVDSNVVVEDSKEDLNKNDTNQLNEYVDLQSRTKDALYELVLAQQEQLSQLQSQLQLFLKHQNIEQAKEKSLEDKREDNKEKDKETVNCEVLSIQEQQQQQLNALQLQVQEFLSSSKCSDKKETSSQCSIGDRTNLLLPTFQSIAVNTGESLLWPTIDMTCSNSETEARGDQLADGFAKSNNEKEKNSICHHCHCHRMRKNMKKDQKCEEKVDHFESPRKSRLNSPSLSDIHAEDMASSIFEDTANSSYSISSFKEIDMPVYDNTHDACTSPVRQRKTDIDWESSPMLGESASMLLEEGQKERVDAGNENLIVEKSEKEHTSPNAVNDSVNEREFYSQVMSQVQKLIEAQNIAPSVSNNSKDDISADDGCLIFNQDNSVPSPEVCLQRVRDATVKQLNEIINHTNNSEPNSGGPLNDRKASQPAGVAATLPRINYISMAVDETLCEESNFHRIAAKYLPDEYLKNEMTEIRNKTVKFEGVYEVNAGKNMNMASVNFSCNMSIASKKYLQRYELGEGDKLPPIKPLGEVNGRVSQQLVKHSIDSRFQDSESDKENILDFKKLRSLPKLL